MATSDTAAHDIAVPAHWRRVADDEAWSFEIQIDNIRAGDGMLTGKGLPVLDQIVAMLPDLLVERPNAGSLQISMDCIPF